MCSNSFQQSNGQDQPRTNLARPHYKRQRQNSMTSSINNSWIFTSQIPHLHQQMNILTPKMTTKSSMKIQPPPKFLQIFGHVPQYLILYTEGKIFPFYYKMYTEQEIVHWHNNILTRVIFPVSYLQDLHLIHSNPKKMWLWSKILYVPPKNDSPMLDSQRLNQDNILFISYTAFTGYLQCQFVMAYSH